MHSLFKNLIQTGTGQNLISNSRRRTDATQNIILNYPNWPFSWSCTKSQVFSLRVQKLTPAKPSHLIFFDHATPVIFREITKSRFQPLWANFPVQFKYLSVSSFTASGGKCRRRRHDVLHATGDGPISISTSKHTYGVVSVMFKVVHRCTDKSMLWVVCVSLCPRSLFGSLNCLLPKSTSTVRHRHLVLWKNSAKGILKLVILNHMNVMFSSEGRAADMLNICLRSRMILFKCPFIFCKGNMLKHTINKNWPFVPRRERQRCTQHSKYTNPSEILKQHRWWQYQGLMRGTFSSICGLFRDTICSSDLYSMNWEGCGRIR
jgi:hypothetical protein